MTPSPSLIIDGRPMTSDEALALCVDRLREEGEKAANSRSLANKRRRGFLETVQPPAPLEPVDESETACPSPEEIKRRCAEIRKEWSPRERQRRIEHAWGIPQPFAFAAAHDPNERESEREQWRRILYGGKGGVDPVIAWSDEMNERRGVSGKGMRNR